MAQRITIGLRGEDEAVRYLQRNGWRIVARNFRVREGEVDVIAARAGILAFVEVKTRRSALFGSPAEAVTHVKQSRIRMLARRYLLETGSRAAEIRFDVIEVMPGRDGVRVNHIEAAF